MTRPGLGAGPSENQHNRFAIEIVGDVRPLPGAGVNSPLCLLLPLHIKIEDDLFNGGLCLASFSRLCVQSTQSVDRTVIIKGIRFLDICQLYLPQLKSH